MNKKNVLSKGLKRITLLTLLTVNVVPFTFDGEIESNSGGNGGSNGGSNGKREISVVVKQVKN